MEETSALKIENGVNQQINMEFEIWVNGTLISKGSNLDELLTTAKSKYPDKAIGIKKAAFSKLSH